MARSPGSTIQTSLKLKEHIFVLRQEGLPLAAIATQVGKDKSYVSRVLKQDLTKQRRKAEALACAVALKKTDDHKVSGPHTLAYVLNQDYCFTEDEIPARDTLFRAVATEAGTYKSFGSKHDNRAYHSYFRTGLTAPCQRIQVDGKGPLTIHGESWYLLVATDRFSRMMYAELVPLSYGSFLAPFIRNVFKHLGIPIELQLDNAVTWRCQRRHPGTLVWTALLGGVERVHFIPESQPKRNDSVERIMRTIDMEFLRLWRVDDTDEGFKFESFTHACEQLAHFVQHYNTQRQHRSLSLRPDSKRFHLTPSDVHVVRSERANPTDQCISFTRAMKAGFAYLHSSTLVACPDWADRYLTWECFLDGTGIVKHKAEPVGTFVHSLTNKHPWAQVITPTLNKLPPSGSKKYQCDYYGEAARVLKNSRHKRPRLSQLPKGWTLEEGSHGDWELRDSDGNYVVCNYNLHADHLGEIVSFENSFPNAA